MPIHEAYTGVFKEGFQMKVTTLREFAQAGGEGEHNCAKNGVHCKETRVGFESMTCSGNCRELRVWNVWCGREDPDHKDLRVSSLRSLYFFLVVMVNH